MAEVQYTDYITFKSVILEKEESITQDPRGVVLTGDALRSLYALGLGKYISSIGQGKSDALFRRELIQYAHADRLTICRTSLTQFSHNVPSE